MAGTGTWIKVTTTMMMRVYPFLKAQNDGVISENPPPVAEGDGEYRVRHSFIPIPPAQLIGGTLVSGLSDLRRSSVSSAEDPHGLEESTFSLGKPMGALANRFSNLRDSWASGTFNDGTIWTARSDYAYDTRILFKRRITTIYISFTHLRSYIDLNYSGFRKIIKKYDKVTYSELKDKYLHDVVETSIPFNQSSKTKLNDCINRLVELYARCVTHNEKSAAKQQLRLHQRENIAWERDTVWRQMIGRERRGEGDPVDLAGGTLVKEPVEPLVDIPTPVGRFKITGKLIWLLIALVVLVVLLNVRVIKDGVEANSCFAILVFCTILWASEVSSLRVLAASYIEHSRFDLGYTPICYVSHRAGSFDMVACHSRR
jgi:phosphate transporter